MATNIEREYLGRDGAEQLVAKIKSDYVTKATGWSELEDKPFGELSIGSDTLYWDGNREGLVRADDYEQYLISESVPTLDDFANGASNTKLDGDTETSTNLGLNTSIYEAGDGAIVVGNSIVALKDGATVGDTTYPKKGTYFTWIGNDCYTTSLTIPGYNGFPSEKQLDSKWLPNHTHTIGPAPITTEGTGAAYTATVDGITALETGLSFTMIPHTTSTSATATLNVNGLGAKMLRRPLSANNATTVANSTASWLYANKPIEVMYNGTYWIVTSMPRPNGPDIYGTVPVANGGVPSATTDEDGKILSVVNGDPAWVDNHVPVTIESVSESSADGGSNVVTFSDGKTLIIKNGSKGSTGAQGEKGLNWCGEWSDAEAYFDDDVVQFNGSAYVAATGGTTAIPDGVSPTDSPASWQLLASKGAAGTTPVKGTDYYTDADKTEMVALVKAALTSETWTFTLSDGSTVTRKVVLG